MKNEPRKRPAGRPEKPQRPARSPGRPIGSVRLTAEVEETILAYILAGTFDYVAAEAAGVSDRTFREWVQRGESRDPRRPPTARLRAFAAAVRKAKAQARAAKEIEIATIDPKFWLTHQGRSRAGREGWTEPVVSAKEEPGSSSRRDLSVAETAQAVQTLVDAGAVPPLRCRCGHHCEKGKSDG